MESAFLWNIADRVEYSGQGEERAFLGGTSRLFHRVRYYRTVHYYHAVCDYRTVQYYRAVHDYRMVHEYRAVRLSAD